MRITKKFFYLIGFSFGFNFVFNVAYSEITTTGPATYTNERGSFTLYDKNGDALPSGTQVVLQLDGSVGNIINLQGESVGSAYATKELALYNRERETMETSALEDEEGNIVAYNEEDYQKKSFELTSLLFGVAEIGDKYCKPAGSELPKSLANWFKAIKEYKEGESSRDKILNDRLALIKSRMADIINNKTNKDLQIEAIQFQIDMTNVSIDSIAGTNLFKGDQQNEETAKTGRLPLREKLLIQALKSISLNGTENLRYRETYQNRLLVSGLDKSLQAATDACSKTKQEKKCEEKDDPEKCTEETVPDAAEGCKEAMAKIPDILNGPALQYMELYLLPQIPSKELNQKMLRLENKMQEMMAAIAKSKDPSFDWHSPMQSGLEEMKVARKSSGAICPSTAGEGDYDASKSNLVASEGEILKVEGADKISESAKDFLSGMGITGNESNEAIELFTKVWNTSDLIIGQSGQREIYYTKFEEKISELIEMDRTKLYELVTLQKKLSSYLEGIKSSLTQPRPLSGLASTSAKAVSDAKDKASMKPVSAAENVTALLASSIGINKASSNQNMNQEIIFSQIGSQSNLIKGLSKVRGMSGGAGSGGTTGGGTTFSGGNIQYGVSLSGGNAAVAKKYVEEIKRNNVRSSYVEKAAKKLRATSASQKNVESKANVTKAAEQSSGSVYNNSLDASFAKLASNPSAENVYKRAAISGVRAENAELISSSVEDGKSPGIGNALLKVVPAIKAEKKATKEVKKDAKKDLKKTAKKSPFRKSGKKNSVNYVYNPSTGNFSETAVVVLPEQEESATTSPVHVTEEKISEDDIILADSIVAKRSKKKDAYDAKEEDSLFTRVTKAYIRNYEKVNKIPEE